jgi:peptidoglycan/xylan/chitin deacetylase (PgdA/CDA1 family)
VRRDDSGKAVRRSGGHLSILILDARQRGSGLLVLVCATLLMSGCAAASPSVIGPVAPAASDTAVSAPAESASAEAAAPTLPALELADAPAPATDQIASTSVDESPADSISDAAVAGVNFVQDAPQVTEAVGVHAPEPAAAPPSAPAAQAERPPPPPDPGTGLSEVIEGGGNGRLEIALTFDAGADTGYGAEILDLLRDEGIPATFGMTGLWAEANPDLVQRMAAEGHQLINHTWDHASLTGANTGLPPMTPEQVTQELGDTEAVVRDLTGGYEMRPYFRPPYGDYDATSLGYLSNNGYYLSIWWTCDSHGWAGWGAQEIVDYCTTNIVEDEILLLHVGAAAAGDFEALPALIDFFRGQGYTFVTIEQMLQP